MDKHAALLPVDEKREGLLPLEDTAASAHKQVMSPALSSGAARGAYGNLATMGTPDTPKREPLLEALEDCWVIVGEPNACLSVAL